MFPLESPKIKNDEYYRCEERGQTTDIGKNLSSIQKNDLVIKEAIYQALWKDNVLRAIEYYEVDVHVKNETVYLYGHIVGTGSQLRIMNAIRVVPGISGIMSHLVLDDKLTIEVATSLGELEHTYGCQFFTGASHGVVSLNGTVKDKNIRSLAETCVASNPNVRGVINNVRISGAEPEVQNQSFLQPAIGETIYFSNGPSGVVKQVIMNPNNRRVIAMVIQGNFSKPRNVLYPLSDGKAKPLEQLIVVPMKIVRYLTKASGFLHIKSSEKDQYQDFDPASFYIPDGGWAPPYPYCPNDALFPVENQVANIEITYEPHQDPFKTIPNNEPLKKQIFVNDSMGG